MKKVLGIGNALVDVLIRIDNDQFLEKFSLPKGSMQLVDEELSDQIIQEADGFEVSLASGGCAANTIHGLSNLGINTSFIGTIGNDKYGDFFERDLINNHIKPVLMREKNRTGKAVALISPDSERTFATFLGAAVELTSHKLENELLAAHDFFHIEGYLVFNQDLIKSIVEKAKKSNLIISIDLASYNVVEANLDFLHKILKEYIDIVFANEEEAKSFTNSEPEQALNELADYCDIAVVKLGDKGSLVKSGSKIHKIDIIQAQSIDTTGAGDLYAAGFLYGLANGLSLDKCGTIGSILSGNVIEEIGAKMNHVRWERIKNAVKKVENA